MAADDSASASASAASGRAIRSYVRRAGRLTNAQRSAVEQHWPAFGLVPQGSLDLDAVFGRAAARYLEIGFGMGDALLEMAACNPEFDYLGVDVHEPGIGRVLRGLSEQALGNVKVIRGDAVQVLREHVPDASLTGVLVYFPDPWPKKRHHKRRLIQQTFVQLLSAKLACGGQLHLATDWEDYASHMLQVVDAEPLLHNLAGDGHYSRRPDARPMTKFEARGTRLGHGVWDLMFERTA